MRRPTRAQRDQISAAVLEAARPWLPTTSHVGTPIRYRCLTLSDGTLLMIRLFVGYDDPGRRTVWTSYWEHDVPILILDRYRLDQLIESDILRVVAYALTCYAFAGWPGGPVQTPISGDRFTVTLGDASWQAWRNAWPHPEDPPPRRKTTRPATKTNKPPAARDRLERLLGEGLV